jgi:hypothetical protein
MLGILPPGKRCYRQCAWCRRAGASKNCSQFSGSHVILSAPGVREIVSVPSKRPIKPIYIQQFLALVDAASEVKQNESQKETDS